MLGRGGEGGGEAGRGERTPRATTVRADLGDVVEGEVEVLEVLHVVQVLHLADDVVLEVEDLETAAVGPQRLVDRLQFLLLAKTTLRARDASVLTTGRAR